jgi:hypothetical protein
MPAKTPEEARTVLVDAVPATGEILYDDLYNNLLVAGERKAIAEFHAMRRSGQLATRIERTDNGAQLYVSRAAATPAPFGSGGGGV